jgi:hypothetical protein
MCDKNKLFDKTKAFELAVKFNQISKQEFVVTQNADKSYKIVSLKTAIDQDLTIILQ